MEAMRAHELGSGDESISAVGGVIYRRDDAGTLEILLIKKRGGFWTLPKGRIEAGESAEEALHREIGEETGLSGVIEATGQVFTYPILKGGAERLKQVRYYLVRATSEDLYLSYDEKIERARWCTPPAALRRIRNPRLHVVVRWAAELLGVDLSA